MWQNLKELYQYRALLMSLVQRELQARYRASVLGFFWTFLNPTLHMLVYLVVFGLFLKQSVPNYPYFMFVGLLPWVWFSNSIVAGASSISDRRDLLTKVKFPAQVLPAQVVAANLVNYVLALPLLVGLGAIFGVLPTWHVAILPLLIVVQLLLTLGLTYLIAAVNVAFRDVQHIISNLMMLTFFVTPILYPMERIPERYRVAVQALNPMAVLSTSYQAIFYEHRLPDAKPLLYVFLMSCALLWASSVLFDKRREEFAELI